MIAAAAAFGCGCGAPPGKDAARLSAAGNTNRIASNAEILSTSNPPAGWQPHTVLRVNGRGEALRLPAWFNLVSGPYGHRNMQMPSLIFMPEKKRLLITAEFGPPPVKTIVMTSDDFGATWTRKRWMRTNAGGEPDVAMIVGTTYLGKGVVTASPESGMRLFSRDFGETWNESYPVPEVLDGKALYHWDPLLVDRDESGRIIRLAEVRYHETGYGRNDPDPARKFDQAVIWFSADVGRTWSEPRTVPEWYGVNELALVRAKNGDIIAGCRTDNPVRFTEIQDMFSGLAVSISRDNGRTWSPLNRLYEYGRHHSSFVVMPDGDIVMGYVVRAGYTDTAKGLRRFGLEAVVSHDNGRTWDLDHKYILAWWTGQCTGDTWWWGLPQSSATVLLPDGSLLTAFSTGFRNEPTQSLCVMDTALVKWRLDSRPVGTDRTISDAPFDSETRNMCDVRF